MALARLSQNSLFYPLPLTNVVVSNVVEAKNVLPATSNGSENLIVFKVLSAVRHRYTVRPPVGFIAAGESVQITIALDPDAIRAQPDAQLPTAETKDSIFIDIARVPADSLPAKTFMAAHASGTVAEASKELQASASAFWHQRGPVKGADPNGARRRLDCVFANKEEQAVLLPEALGGPEVPPAVPTSRPPPTGDTHPGRTDPPESPPSRSTANSPSAITPASNTERPPTPSTAAPATAAAAPSEAPAKAKVGSLLQAGKDLAARERAKKKGVISQILNYRISYAAVAVLVVLSVLCGVYDRNTILSRIIAGR